MENPKETHRRDLMVLSQAGNTTSYRELLLDVQSLVGAWLRSRVSIVSEREEVGQEIMMAIHKSLHTYQPNISATGWILTISKYKLIDYYRKSGRRKMSESIQHELVSQYLDSQLPLSHSLDEGLESDLAEAMSQMPERQRQAVELVKLQNMDIRSAAKNMGVSEGSLKVLAHRGYKFLRKALVKDTK